ncbi:MFS transporter [Paenalkalicoccus suaedae]|uniref:MFS transporter n=1 Tax=Paenalkalicoccus suaedae TaxID=2592382 RepID=A0A859FCD5_9BACI|nr:MFS transporter [Paenalkalicoccus suaedae]QKS70498.1 MFS transporter [Paenalkalicoccus suaedae]
MDHAQKLKQATYHLYTFMISKMISSFGAQVYAFAMSFYILQVTGSATSFAMNLVCSIVPRTIAGPIAGVVADRYPKKRIVITAQILMTVTIAVLLLIVLTQGLSLTAIYMTTAILATASSFSSIAFTSSITGLIDQERIQKATSLNQISISFAAIASPAVGGLLYGTVSIPTILLLYIVASSIAVLLESTMQFTLFTKENTDETPSKESAWESFKSGIRYVGQRSVMMTMISISLIVNFFIGAFEIGYSYILIDTLQVESTHFGVTQGAFSLGMLVLSIYFVKRQEVQFPLLFVKWGIVALGFIIAGISLPLFISMSYTFMIVYFILIQLAMGATIMIINTPLQVMLQKTIQDEFKGRVFSVLETCAMALVPLSMIIYGYLYDRFPSEQILLISVCMLVGAVLYLGRASVIKRVHPELRAKTKLREKEAV